MANTLTLIEATPNSLCYRMVEAATAAAVLTTDVAGDLVAGPLQDLLTASYASQALARTAWEAAVDVSVQARINTPAGGTGGVTPTIDQNVAATAFRLETNSAKAANGDVATFVLRFSFRHSIVD